MTSLGILAILLFFILIVFFNGAMKDGWYLFMHRTGLQAQFIKPEKRAEIEKHLGKFSYYLNLSSEGREKFIERLFVFLLNKQFKGRSGLVITEEMKVLVSASAIQLTYGLDQYKLESLQTIFIYPDIFHLNVNSPEYKGATTGHFMHLSWKAFVEGYSRSDDNLNLGLHEMTHALKLTLHLGSRFDKLFAARMEYWEELLIRKFKTFSQTPSFLRSYAKANTEEFFAVCVEAFFESPEKFKRELPEIFQLLTFLLNQDILNKSGDYKIDEDYFTGNIYKIPYPENMKSSYKYSHTHWSVNLLVLGTVGFLPTYMILSHYFLFPTEGYFILLFCMGTIGLLQKRYFFERRIFSGVYFILYSYAGFGASFTMLLLWLNFLIPVSATYVEKFDIINPSGIHGYTNLNEKRNVELENALYKNEQVLDLKERRGKKYLIFNYHYGILGIRKVDNAYFTNK